MADYEPSFETIANKWADVLSQATGFKAYYLYPENAVDPNELPCVVINEFSGVGQSGFTHGAVSVTYTGIIDFLVLSVETGQARLLKGDINHIAAAQLKLGLAVHANRLVKGYFSHVALGEGKVARLSPYDPDNRGNYGGLEIPYSITMQYRS